MLTFISLSLLAVAIYQFVAGKVNSQRKEENVSINVFNNTANSYDRKPLWRMLPTFGKTWIYAILGVVVFTLNGAFFWADAGTAYAVQYPWGGDKMVSTQGLKAKWWGRTIPLKYEVSIKDIIPKKNEDGRVTNIPDNSEGAYNRPAHRWEFSDAIKADIATAVVVGVSVDDEQSFLNMADRNGSEGRLIYGRVLPNIDAALKNTCKLMDAQEYISGKASDFDRYFRDQLEHGMYLVEEYVEESQEPEIIGDTTTVRRIGKPMSNNKQTKYRIKKDSQGNIMRDNNSNSLVQYGIQIYQAQVTGIDWEQSFDKRLDLQKDEVAKTQLEKQEAERQFYTAKKEIAKGEAEKASERAKLEKEQIKLTIAAETKAKVANQNVIVEKAQLEVEKYKAQSKKVAADAIYYENAKRVQAGLTPQERAEWEYKTAVGVAGQLKDLKLPSTYFSGSGGNNKGNGLLTDLIGANLASGMVNQNKK